MTPLLELADTSFSYAGREVLRAVNLTVEAGTCAALAGPNGAGKTTLLRLIVGTLQASSGHILLDGQPLSAMPREERARKIALVPQELDIPFDFTVQQIVEQGRTPHIGLFAGPGREDRRAVDHALELTGLTRFCHRIFNELSGGERQRVKIALGLAQQPRLLLLDEPTQNLDIGRQAELMDLLHHLRDQGITLFASIHDLHLVRDNFSSVHLLGPGKTLLSGSPEEILTHANLMSSFDCTLSRHPLLAHTPEREIPR